MKSRQSRKYIHFSRYISFLVVRISSSFYPASTLRLRNGRKSYFCQIRGSISMPCIHCDRSDKLYYQGFILVVVWRKGKEVDRKSPFRMLSLLIVSSTPRPSLTLVSFLFLPSFLATESVFPRVSPFSAITNNLVVTKTSIIHREIPTR